jgi:hypothetical protein
MKDIVLSNLVHLPFTFNTLSALCSMNKKKTGGEERSSFSWRSRRDLHLLQSCLLLFVTHGARRQDGHHPRHSATLQQRHIFRQRNHDGLFLPEKKITLLSHTMAKRSICSHGMVCNMCSILMFTLRMVFVIAIHRTRTISTPAAPSAPAAARTPRPVAGQPEPAAVAPNVWRRMEAG